MADPRFYDNRGPFTLAEICQRAGVALPPSANGAVVIEDLAGLEGAGPKHLTFYSGGRELAPAFARSHAGVCLVASKDVPANAPQGVVLVPVKAVSHAFAAIAALFYLEASQARWTQKELISPDAKLGKDVMIGPAP